MGGTSKQSNNNIILQWILRECFFMHNNVQVNRWADKDNSKAGHRSIVLTDTLADKHIYPQCVPTRHLSTLINRLINRPSTTNNRPLF